MTDRNHHQARTTASEDTRLVRLEDLDDYEIADGEPDIRGWDVKTASDRKVGEVKNLIVSPAEMSVRYIEIELDKDALPESQRDSDDDERRVLLPIGAARLDDHHDVVYLDGQRSAGMSSVPRFGKGELTQDRERQLRNHYQQERAEPAIPASRDSTSDTDSRQDENSFFGKRRESRQGQPYLMSHRENR